MGFLDSFFNKVSSVGQNLFNGAKRIGAGAYSGVKKGLEFGKNVISTSRDIANSIRNIPVLGQIANQLVNNPIVTTAEQGIDTALLADKVVSGISEIAKAQEQMKKQQLADAISRVPGGYGSSTGFIPARPTRPSQFLYQPD